MDSTGLLDSPDRSTTVHERKKREVVKAEFFTWTIYQVRGTWYADGRNARVNRCKLGRYSLGTADRDEALRTVLPVLDRKMAERRLRRPENGSSLTAAGPLLVEEGVRQFLEDRQKPGVMCGVR